ncbi:MAG: 30S ribosomal protein S17 [Candidatus Omnitrophota bacterium]
MRSDSSGQKKEIVGTVISDRMDKAVTVRWEVRKKHPLYKKYITWHKSLMAHDANNEATVGDTVKIRESRPLSKQISWKVVEIVEKAQKG